jgi:hypothetical protein
MKGYATAFESTATLIAIETDNANAVDRLVGTGSQRW